MRVHIGLTSELDLLRQSTADVLERELPTSRVRDLYDDDDGFDRSLWQSGADLGWFSMLVAEDLGGGSVTECGLADLAVVAEELGRALFPGPFLPTNVVAFALSQNGTAEQRTAYLPGLLGGRSTAAWAYAEAGGSWTPEAVTTRVWRDRGDIVVAGTKTFVQDAAVADLILVTARAFAGPTQVLIPADTPGVEIRPLETLDLGRRLAEVRLDGVRLPASHLLGSWGNAASAVEDQHRVALVLQCAESNGVTDRGFTTTVQYSKDRVAFGRPIGSYQALKHRMAGHRVWLEGSFATADYAAASVGAARPDAGLAARIANAHVGRTSTAILHDCIQIHGGIAMTWDYDLHLFLRRAISNEALMGSPAEHQRALVDLAEEYLGVG